MKNNNIFAVIGNSFTYVLTALQTNEIFQIIELVLSIIISLLIIISKIRNWWKEANQDGKVTKEEIQQIGNDIAEDVNDLKDKINKKGE